MSSPYTGPSSPTTILSLPAELLESIIVSSSHLDGPSAIVSLSKAKSTFYELIYKSPDSHLWREVFLSQFDDPRKLGSLLGVDASVDWEGEYKQRIKAKNHIKAHLDDPLSVSDDFDLEASNLAPLVPMVLAAPSIPSSSIDTFSTISEPICPWPPLSREAVISSSLNSGWLDGALSHGYPANAVSRFLLFQPKLDEQTNPRDRETWDQSSTGQAFHHILLLFGFKCAPNFKFWRTKGLTRDSLVEKITRRRTRFATTEEDETQVKDKGKGKAKARDIEEITFDNVIQMKMARNAAKLRVYNMKFPDPQRCWGPFMPIPSLEPRKPANGPELLPIFRNGSPQILAFGPLIGLGEDSILEFNARIDEDDEDDPNDTDYEDREDNADEDENDDPNRPPPYLPLFLLNQALAGGDPDEERHPTFIFPPFPHELKPDWSFLASARVLIEANVRDRAHVVHSDPRDREAFLEAMEALKNLDHLRMGGAPGFEWDKWRRLNGKAEEAEEMDLTVDDKGKGKEASDDEVDGWDWAGVTGEWRRIVCWMDYHGLIHHNGRETAISHLSESTNMVVETIRVMPMSLRVSGYSKPPTPPPDYHGSGDNPLSSLVYTLPIIRVEGESRGSDLDDGAHRQIRGTVRMIGDGAVRWSLTSSEAGIQDPEWVTESVQIGQVGSAMGMIGMWTGVDHARSDPIGPCWAWKISSPYFDDVPARRGTY
ncbi:uncharacterized protein EV420DRAFT_1633727 [Desarmillaria tabescens]|uniref:F-box domain-containing protein n=1 Tax=Armillaria tabescens TaxID=1929756 RepID=A0AA39NPC2_ARMTA|nr:uncharacterized protein EV420DRAFT_1633727 [Desarmillaria tabescens]KAK0469311.1 hypothetical protein EV420DRAFT_1633727 [Desarmillaria tabescens]